MCCHFVWYAVVTLDFAVAYIAISVVAVVVFVVVGVTVCVVVVVVAFSNAFLSHL